MHLRALSVPVVAAAAILLAGCGSSSGGSSGTTGSGPKGTPVKVGVLCSCSGSFGTSINAGGKVAEAWAKSVNASGGINGHPVKITKYDDAGNPGTSVSKAQSLISAKVDVILDLTPLDQTWAKAAADAKIPVVGGELTSAIYSTDPNAYASGQTSDALPYSLVSTGKQAGATKLGLLYCAEAPSCQETVPGIKAAGQKLGLPVVYTGSISATAANYTAQCVAAKQAGVTGIIVSHSATSIANVGRDCDRQGYRPVIIEAGTGFTTMLTKATGTKDRLWAAFPVLPFFADTPAVQKMNRVVDQYYPGLRDDEKAWSSFATQAWTGGLLIERAVKASGVASGADLSADAVTRGLDSLKDETLDGWAPPLTFTAGKPHPVNCWFTARIQNGTPSLTGGGKLTCQTPS